MEYESAGDVYINLNAFGMVTKGLVRGLEDLEIQRRVETFQTTALMRSACILKRFLKTSDESRGKSSANAGVKKLSDEQINV